MVTAEAKQAESKYVAWDAFLREQVGGPSQEALERVVAGFRRSEWPNILRDLKTTYRWDWEDGLEPHWVAPGRAVYWQEQIARQVVTRTNEDGSTYREWEEVSRGWTPTSGMPANNAWHIDHYLQKGLRLRPPESGVDVKVLEDAVPSEALQQPELEKPPEYLYSCDRHGRVQRFRSWKQYLRHCAYRREIPIETPPQGILNRMKRYVYFCQQHGIGFKSRRMALMHVREESGKSVRVAHASVQQMEVSKQ